MSSTRFLLACVIALLAIACDEPPEVSMPYAFLRPKHLEFACFAPTKADPSTFGVLPRACCIDTTEKPFDTNRWRAEENCTTELLQGYEAPRLHALVSQTIRGEIAAVDLAADASDRTLDSNRTVPGYTFIDSGGLPSALVVPARQPRSPARLRGPEWVYVASAEQYEVRAIPTCAFRSGKRCGPELALAEELDDPAALSARTKVVLPSAPGDMVLGPDDALWVTLPELGLLARIPTAEPEGGGSGEVTDAFAIDPATQQPLLPQFFRVPVPQPVAPPAPVAESTVYQDLCGLGIDTSDKFLTSGLPHAPRAEPTASVRPARLRYDAVSKSLLVADAQAPFIHAFSLDEEGVLTWRGGLPTGAPIRDFAVTPKVPSTAALPMSNGANPPILVPPEDPSTQTQRYLYAVDGRDGSLMAFDFTVDDATSVPRLTPLLAPANDLRFSDRLDSPQPITALDVIDTRERSEHVCGAPWPPKEVARFNESEDDLVRAEATADSLRGVFLITAAARGVLGVIDVHDLNLACRDNDQCADPPGSESRAKAKNQYDRVGVAIRRHALRRRYAGSLEVTLPDSKLLETQACGSDYVSWDNQKEAQACVSKDPWNMISETWNADYLGPIPGTRSPSGVFEETGNPNELILRAPGGLDFCARGALTGDVVALMDIESSTLPTQCNDLTSAETETLLLILEARRDTLRIGPGPVPGNAERFARLRTCFPELVPFEVRAQSFLVTGSSGAYLHNITADAQDRCVVDSQKDPRLSARATAGQVFANPFVSFTLKNQSAGAQTINPQSIQTVSVQVQQGTQALAGNIVRYQSGDALPAAIHYVPEVGDVFVLDGTSQGLIRFNLTPFERRNDN